MAACPDSRDCERLPSLWSPAGCGMRARIGAHFVQRAAEPATERPAETVALMNGGGSRLGRSAGLERIMDLAALALAMAQDPVDDARIRNDGDNLHFCAAARTQHRIDFEYLAKQARPGPADLLREI